MTREEEMFPNCFKSEDFKEYDSLPKELHVFQGVDLAISNRYRMCNSHFALVTIGVNKDYEIFILDTFRGCLIFREQVQTIVKKVAEFNPVRIGIEVDSHAVPIMQALMPYGPLPVKPVFPPYDEMGSAFKLNSLFNDGKIFFGKEQDQLKAELLSFPNGRPNDVFRAFEIAFDIAWTSFKSIKLIRIPGI